MLLFLKHQFTIYSIFKTRAIEIKFDYYFALKYYLISFKLIIALIIFYYDDLFSSWHYRKISITRKKYLNLVFFLITALDTPSKEKFVLKLKLLHDNLIHYSYNLDEILSFLSKTIYFLDTIFNLFNEIPTGSCDSSYIYFHEFK